MKKNKLKKLVPGMTLIEILVALAIFAIMGMMIAVSFTGANRLYLVNHRMNKDIDTQTITAETKDLTNASTPIENNFTLTFGPTSIDFDIEGDRYLADNTIIGTDELNMSFFQADQPIVPALIADPATFLYQIIVTNNTLITQDFNFFSNISGKFLFRDNIERTGLFLSVDITNVLPGNTAIIFFQGNGSNDAVNMRLASPLGSTGHINNMESDADGIFSVSYDGSNFI